MQLFKKTLTTFQDRRLEPPPSAPTARLVDPASSADEAGGSANPFTAGDRFARQCGYTLALHIEGGTQDGEFLVRPDADLDGLFRAWGVDWQEWTLVHGCNVVIEQVRAVERPAVVERFLLDMQGDGR